MRLVLSKQSTASAQDKIVLMYEYDGKKVVESYAAGSTFEVEDEEALVILSTPHLKGIVSVEGAKVKDKAVSAAPRNK